MAQLLFDLIWNVYYYAIRTRQLFLANFGIDLADGLPILLSCITLYFTLLSVYRTSRFTLRIIYFVIKWSVILWVVGASAGFFMSGGQSFGWGPVLEEVLSQASDQFGWESPPEVVTERHGARVNGVQPDVPLDYHQYGAAWQKFKGKSPARSKRGPTTKPRSIFDRFDSSASTDSSTLKPGQPKSRRHRSSSSDPNSPRVHPAASIAQRLFGQALNFDMEEAWRSVGTLQEEVKESFEAVKGAFAESAEEGYPAPPDQSWWTAWGYQKKQTSRGGKSGEAHGGTNSR